MAMDLDEEDIRSPRLEVEAQIAKPNTMGNPAAGEYFERYERIRGEKEQEGESSIDYWLSEEEEETHQVKRQKWKSRHQKDPYVVQNAKGPKLRTAEGVSNPKEVDLLADELCQLDVLKRLRWDPGLQKSNFTIGYLERFEGVKEIPMAEWITETSDKDFIPQHRIKYFKGNDDGKIMWDREGRIDKIFGSGLT